MYPIWNIVSGSHRCRRAIDSGDRSDLSLPPVDPGERELGVRFLVRCACCSSEAFRRQPSRLGEPPGLHGSSGASLVLLLSQWRYRFDGIMTARSCGGQRGVLLDARTLHSLGRQVLDAYFGPLGIEFSLARVPMGSCDFSVEQYSFADVPDDFDLEHFDDGVRKDTVQRVRATLASVGRADRILSNRAGENRRRDGYCSSFFVGTPSVPRRCRQTG